MRYYTSVPCLPLLNNSIYFNPMVTDRGTYPVKVVLNKGRNTSQWRCMDAVEEDIQLQSAQVSGTTGPVPGGGGGGGEREKTHVCSS